MNDIERIQNDLDRLHTDSGEFDDVSDKPPAGPPVRSSSSWIPSTLRNSGVMSTTRGLEDNPVFDDKKPD